MKHFFLTILFVFTLFSCDKHECMQLKSNITDHLIVGGWSCYKIEHKGEIIENIPNIGLDVYNDGGITFNIGSGIGSVLGGVGSINKNTVTVQRVRHNPNDGKDYIDLVLVFDILKITKSELIIKLINYPADGDIGDIWYLTKNSEEPI